MSERYYWACGAEGDEYRRRPVVFIRDRFGSGDQVVLRATDTHIAEAVTVALNNLALENNPRVTWTRPKEAADAPRNP